MGYGLPRTSVGAAVPGGVPVFADPMLVLEGASGPFPTGTGPGNPSHWVRGLTG